MDEVWLSRLGYVLGECERPIEDSADLVTPAAELRRAGFGSQHVCADGTTAHDLAVRVTRAATVAGPLDPDLLLHGTAIPRNAAEGSERFDQTRDVKHLMDFSGSRLVADFGWDRAIVAGLTEQACTTVLGGWRMAAAMLSVEPGWRQAVCVTSDRFPPGAIREQAYNPISDAATIAVLGREATPGAYRLRTVHQVTNGGLGVISDTETAGTFFPWMHRAVTETLERAGVSAADLDWVAPQNIHRVAWQVLGPLLGIPPERVHEGTRERLGHLVAGDNVANLLDLAATGRLEPGQLVLLTAAGYGANWQCAVLEVGPR